jgi:hypothetical protein
LDTINSAAFLGFVKEILSLAIPGVSAGDSFGKVYGADQYRGSFWLPCYVRRVGRSETEIRKDMNAYASNGTLDATLSSSTYRITYAKELSYRIGITEPPTSAPTLQPGGGSAGSTLAPAQSNEGRVEVYLVSEASIL